MVERIFKPVNDNVEKSIKYDECFKTIRNYRFIQPDLSMDACNSSLQMKLTRVSLDRGYCQYYTLLTCLTYFINDGYSFEETTRKLESLNAPIIYFLLLKLQSEFVKWIRTSYMKYYEIQRDELIEDPDAFMESLKGFRRSNKGITVEHKKQKLNAFKYHLFVTRAGKPHKLIELYSKLKSVASSAMESFKQTFRTPRSEFSRGGARRRSLHRRIKEQRNTRRKK